MNDKPSLTTNLLGRQVVWKNPSEDEQGEIAAVWTDKDNQLIVFVVFKDGTSRRFEAEALHYLP